MMNNLKLMRIEHQQKFPNKEEAIKEANTIAQFVLRLVQKNDMSCKALICTSQNDIKTSIPLVVKSGNRGRPAYRFYR